ncbi:hypothetical protein ACA910_018840 [Epithemia clementina (nom. ined.)]
MSLSSPGDPQQQQSEEYQQYDDKPRHQPQPQQGGGIPPNGDRSTTSTMNPVVRVPSFSSCGSSSSLSLMIKRSPRMPMMVLLLDCLVCGQVLSIDDDPTIPIILCPVCGSLSRVDWQPTQPATTAMTTAITPNAASNSTGAGAAVAAAAVPPPTTTTSRPFL